MSTDPAVLSVGQASKLSRVEARKAAEIMMGSSIEIKVRRQNRPIPGGKVIRELQSITLELGGKIAHFPSKSNISHVWNAKRIDMKVRLYALTQLYVAKLIEMGEPLPSFGEDRIHALLLCARHKVHFDSHNETKALCDWLEAVGVVDNDTQIEAEAKKKEWYVPEMSEQFTSTVIIQRFQNVRSLIRETCFELLSVAAGSVLLVG
jgi:hypothetical protein